MRLSSYITAPLIRFLLRRICRVYSAELKKLPKYGPVIFAMNHINFLEVPLVFTHLRPRPVYGIVKKETWEIPFLRFLAWSWEAIPLDRNNTSMETMRIAGRILGSNKMLLIAVSIALRSDAVIIPIGHYGGERFWSNFKAFRRTKFFIKAGRPFRIQPDGVVNSGKRQEIADEIMMQIAELLPEHMHGIYKDRIFTTKYIQYTEEL
jgi:1-acyl-sn-glycerol-3-phosphate acyltransferase